MQLRRLSASVLALVMVSSVLWAFTLNARAEMGSADAFGYRWTDSDSPDPTVGFSWVEISGTGTNTGLYYDDYWDGPFSVGFTFPFYENSYSDFYVTTNGYISFGSGDYDYSNDPIPDSWEPNNFVAAYWDDLYVETSGGVYYQTLGSSPNRQLVVEWLDTRQLSASEYMNFEIILNETGEIWTQYNWLSGDMGWDCTVGIENSVGTIGCQYSYESGVLHDALAVMYSLAPVAIGPDGQQLGAPGTDVYHWLDVRNNQGFVDSFDITYSSLEGWAVGLYDGMLNPLVDNNGNGIPDTGDVAPLSSVSICAIVTVADPPAVQFEQTTVVATSFFDSGLWDDALLITQAAGAVFAPPHIDWGDDTDGDGLYDYLVVDVQLDVLFSDDYYVYGYLYDPSMIWLDTSYAGDYLASGSGTLQVRFDGYTIRNNGVDGMFDVDLYLYDSSWNYLGSGSHVTAFYAASEFELPPIEFTPPHADSGLDTGGDLLYNYLIVDVSVFVNDPGYFRIDSTLFDSSGGGIASDNNETYLDAGANVIELRYPGHLIRSYGVDGPYIVNMDLYFWDDSTGWWTWLDADQHTTSAYLWPDFNGPPATFAPPHTDWGVDQTGEGRYEFLVVGVSLDVAEPCTIELRSWLYDSLGNYVSYVSNLTFVDAGLQTVELWFPGWEIYMNGVNGNFHVYIELYDVDGYYFGSDWHTTGYYDYVDFQALAEFMPPHADQGLDIDGDGLFNYLVIEAQVYVLMDDYYDFVLQLWDMFGGNIWVGGNYTYLEAGMHTITWLVPGWYILDNGVDGPYDAYLDVYWDFGPLLDSDIHMTGPYLYTDFNGPPAVFAPPHDDFGYDEDGDLLFDYLVIEVMVDVDLAGEYQVEGSLYDSFGIWLGYASNYTYLDTGPQVVELWYLAWEINENGVDGPYYADLYLRDLDWNSLDYNTHTTQPYAWSDFEPYPASLSPPHSDYGLDLNSDMLYDYLVVEVSVEVLSAGYFEIDGGLVDMWGNYIASDDNFTYLDVGPQTVDLIFPGWLIRNNGVDGPFTVYIYLYSEDGLYLDDGSHTTAMYYWDEFQGPPAEFSPPHEDHGLDTDSDGLYEYLVVVANVDVTVAGTYLVAGVLYDGVTAMIATNLTYLDTGLQAVELKFFGWQLFSHQANGSYVVELYILTQDMTMIDVDSYVTNLYQYDEFDSTVPSLSSKWTRSPPTIDGAISAGEWADANSLDMTSADPFCRLEGTLLVMNNATHLFIAYDVMGDLTESSSDGASVSFDTGNDGIFNNEGDDIFVIGYGTGEETVHANYLLSADDHEVDCAPFDDTLPDHAGLAGARGFGPSDASVLDHRMYEFSIPLALINATPGDVTGFVAGSFWTDGIYDSETDEFSSWPMVAPSMMLLTDFANLSLAILPETTASLSGTMGLDNWYVSDVTVTLTAVDGQGGVDYTTYRVDGGTWQIYSAPFDVTGDGSHMVEFYSVDNGGNTESIQSVSFDIDVNAPTTTATLAGTGAGQWWSTDVDITLSVDDGTGSGVDVTQYRVDGGAWQDYSATFTVSGAGSHTVEFYSTDFAGNDEATVSIDVNIDTSDPVTSHALTGTLGENSWYTTAVSVTLTATDTGGSGVDMIRYRVNGGSWQTYSAAISVSADGTSTIDYYAVDHAGNTEASKAVTVKVDKTAPTTVAAVDEGKVTLSATDATSGVDFIQYRIDSGSWTNYTAAFNVTGKGNHTVEFRAVDNAGNTESTKTTYVEIGGGGGISGAALMGIIALVVIVAVVIVVLLLMKKRKAAGPPPGEPEEFPPPEEGPPGGPPMEPPIEETQ